MKLQELKDFLNTLSEEQLNQSAWFFEGDETDPVEIDSWEVSEEDIYWEHHGDCLGTLEEAKKTLGENWDSEKDELAIIRKGTVTFHSL
jgi:hypothetical protein